MDVWREACRHIEIGESTGTIAAILDRHMPTDRVIVRQIDRERSCVETVAVGSTAVRPGLQDARRECSAAEIDEAAAWCERGEVAHLAGSRAAEPPVDVLVPSAIESDMLVGPLGDAAGRRGALVLVASREGAFHARHRALAKVLLEPFSVALENDHRLREMAALREAAEADRQSLLARLGRKKLADTIVGAESGLRAVMERVELVARSDAPVLILGETGTGKELLARAIHAKSPRSAGPVHRVNCGAIPLDLIDSELFGHERGAFTGAVDARRGWFERADGGTLFLDEIGDLPPAAQVRLLRILQDGWLERVGGHQPIKVDVRIVAATHRDLSRMVAEGRFREDLWYRISVFPIVLPPLRERRDDVAKLAAHFAQRAAIRFGLPPVMPTPADLRLLEAYPWPGNVRELGAVIDRAAILGNGERLDVATALGVSATSAAPPREEDQTASSPAPVAIESLSLDAVVRRHIEAVLAATRGRIEGPCGAAVRLQVNPHTLRARMRKLGIDWSRFRDGPGA